MPDIIAERIQGIPPEWAKQHPIIRVYLDDHPHGWALEAWTQGRRILRDEGGDGATYSMEVPPAVTRAIYGWLNTVAPIWTSNWFTVHDTSIEWEDYETGDYVLALQDITGPIEVSMGSVEAPDGECEATAFISYDGSTRLVSDDNYRKHIKAVAKVAHKYFYPN